MSGHFPALLSLIFQELRRFPYSPPPEHAAHFCSSLHLSSLRSSDRRLSGIPNVFFFSIMEYHISVAANGTVLQQFSDSRGTFLADLLCLQPSSTHTFTSVIRFCVSVPVLSEQITETLPAGIFIHVQQTEFSFFFDILSRVLNSYNCSCIKIISLFIFTNPYRSYKGRPMSVASSDIKFTFLFFASSVKSSSV